MINYTRILPVNITGPEFEDFVNTALQYVRQEANLDGIEKWVRDGHPEDLTQERRNAMLRLLVVFEDRLLTEAGYSREEAQVMFPRFREGEDVNTRDVDGQTAFFVAVVEGNENMVATFLRNPDVNPNIPNNNGVMPLHVAVEFGYTNIAIQLIQNRRINVNAQNGDGNTALHLAVMGRNAQIVQALLGHPRIDREVQNAAGLTAADEAAEREFYEILELLFQ
jgi:hypothetical protein